MERNNQLKELIPGLELNDYLDNDSNQVEKAELKGYTMYSTQIDDDLQIGVVPFGDDKFATVAESTESELISAFFEFVVTYQVYKDMQPLNLSSDPSADDIKNTWIKWKIKWDKENKEK